MSKTTKKLKIKKPSPAATGSNASEQPKPKVERWRICELNSHPLQDEYFGNLPGDQLQLLADSLQHNGQIKPIVVTGDGTMLSGHQTLRAAKLLGWTRIDAIVRRDITDPLSEAAMQVFLDSNLAQRSLTPLEAARILKYRLEHRDGKRAKNGEGELRDTIAGKIDMTGRNLGRYVELLDAPPEVQDAVAGDRLPLQWALRVLVMTAKQQRRVVTALTNDAATSKTGRKAVVDLIKRLAGDPSVQKAVRGTGKPAGALQRLRTTVGAVLAGGSEIASHATADDVRLARKVYRLLKEHAVTASE